jgi:hypothetical protein
LGPDLVKSGSDYLTETATEKFEASAQVAADVALVSAQGILQGFVIMIVPLVLAGIGIGFAIRAINSTSRLVSGGSI